MITLTHWISPLQESTGNIHETIAQVKAATPRRWRPRVLVPALYGMWWQGDFELQNTLHMDLRPKDPDDLRWIADRFLEADVECGAWGVPRHLSVAEGKEHGRAAAVVDLYVLDVEPYAGFLYVFTRSPSEFIAGFREYCPHDPDISVVPQPSGIEPLGDAWREWLNFCNYVRPQCYWTDGAALNWPRPSGPYLLAQMRRAGIRRAVVPIFPGDGGGRLGQMLGRARSDRDIWTLRTLR